MRMYEVGGCVRDEILNVPTKDIDFTVVLDEDDLIRSGSANPFNVMVQRLTQDGFKIFLETPDYFTVRAKFPRGHAFRHLTADFVLARKESGYADGRRPDKVEVGTLEDDLARRDFTMNAIAKGGDGYIDPFGGVQDIRDKVIRAVGDPFDRLTEDALRAVRAMRFAITKGFTIDARLKDAMFEPRVLDRIQNKISDERIQVELSKMLRHDALGSIQILNEYRPLSYAMLSGKVNLDATLRQKGFGA